MPSRVTQVAVLLIVAVALPSGIADDSGSEFFEKKIRPLLVQHCYECHSEEAGERQGGLLLDRRSGWIKGGTTEEAVLPGEPAESLLIKAVHYDNEDLQMPPDGKLSSDEIALLFRWVKMGAPGPASEVGESEFSRLGDQEFLFEQAKTHWAFQPLNVTDAPESSDAAWNKNAIDQFVSAKLEELKLKPSVRAEASVLLRRLSYDLIGLPPSFDDVRAFEEAFAANPDLAVSQAVDRLMAAPQFGEHFARMWLDVARYGDTDGAYRPDTKTPHYFPFAFTYRDYVIRAFNADKPFDRFVQEQLAADLLPEGEGSAPLEALGFLTVGPHANRNQTERIDDWIDVTTRGLLGLTVACARCHDHKYEPVPTADYYSLHGVFSSVIRIHPLDEKKQPQLTGYQPTAADAADYAKKRAAIDMKIKAADGKKAKNNNRPVSLKIRETELAELLLFHPGAPAHAMIVKEAKRPVEPFIMVRGEASQKGDTVPRRFLQILDSAQTPFPANVSGRLELANHIVDPSNPMTARVFVNRVWGYVMGSYLVDSPSDFGLQGARPTHPALLDWLADDFVSNGWSLKHLVRQIVLSRTYQQSSDHRSQAADVDPENQWLWRANRSHLSIEELRDSVLTVCGQMDDRLFGRAEKLWGKKYTRRRALYGYINRFNLDPTLRAFDFPTPMQSQAARQESIVPTQALFTMNSPFVVDQAKSLTTSDGFLKCETDEQRIAMLFEAIFQRTPAPRETERVLRFLELQKRHKPTARTDDKAARWPLTAQAMIMSNEFQYID